MTEMATTTVAAVQATPVFLDREATTDKAVSLISAATEAGAGLVVFPEAFIPTYPDWVWRLPAWADAPFARRLYAESVEVPGPTVARLAEAARASGVYVAIGVNERSGATLYNTLLYLAPDGTLVGNHRKLMPTGGERTIWGVGDGSTLDVVRTPFGVIGGLLCWENYMPLARAAMYAQGVDIYLAPTWDNSDVWLATLRHIAKEGGCYVLGIAPVLRATDVPIELRGDTYGDEHDWMSRGQSAIIAPGGDVLAGPLAEQEGILYATIDPDLVQAQHRHFDPVGHYSRPDVFNLHVDTTHRQPVTMHADPAARHP